MPWGAPAADAASGPAGGADAPARVTPELAAEAAAFLRAFGHEGRLLILCHLTEGERSVAELERLLSSRQPAVSQQLGRLRADGLVEPRREGKQIYYRIKDPKVVRLISVLCEMFEHDA